jgi:two-component system, OmpR family, response regulator
VVPEPTTLHLAVVEDDVDLSSALVRGLEWEGFEVTVSHSAQHLLEHVDCGTPDAFVIDIGLPDSDGRDLCQTLRARGITRPVLFVTGRVGLPEILSAFHAGGDDYLLKPFEFKELVVRLHALLRRSSRNGHDAGARLTLDPSSHAARVDDRLTQLSPTEYRLLARLAAQPGEVVRRQDLVSAAWPDGAIVRDNTLDAYVCRLRRKLREMDAGGSVVTVHRVGYRLG